MANWDEVMYTTKELASAVGRKVNDVAGVTKQKIKMVENDRAICNTLEALGKLLYENRRGGIELDEDLVSELVKQVDELRISNRNIQQAIDLYYERKICSCGAVNSYDAAYCQACGKQL